LNLARFVLSFGGLGHLPVAPGTWGTLGAMLAAGALLEVDGVAGEFRLVAAGVVIVAVGLTVLLTPDVEVESGKDPGVIVMDEVAGYWATLLVFERPGWTQLVAAFFVFRLFDIVKPWPGRALERLPSGWGVALDDVMAGVYGAALLGAAQWIAAHP
jgi:phosphatidylglycerophosphatase A